MLTKRTSGRKRHAPREEAFPITHNGRTVGYYYPQRRLHSRRWFQRHLVQRFNAIGYDAAVIDELEALGCEVLENVNPETGHKYRCALAKFRAEGIAYDLGFGDQVCLPLREWVHIGPNGQRMDQQPQEEPQAAPADVQLGLFAEVPA